MLRPAEVLYAEEIEHLVSTDGYEASRLEDVAPCHYICGGKSGTKEITPVSASAPGQSPSTLVTDALLLLGNRARCPGCPSTWSWPSTAIPLSCGHRRTTEADPLHATAVLTRWPQPIIKSPSSPWNRGPSPASEITAAPPRCRTRSSRCFRRKAPACRS